MEMGCSGDIDNQGKRIEGSRPMNNWELGVQCSVLHFALLQSIVGIRSALMVKHCAERKYSLKVIALITKGVIVLNARSCSRNRKLRKERLNIETAVYDLPLLWKGAL